MNQLIEIAFWISFILFFHTWFFYPVGMWLLTRLHNKTVIHRKNDSDGLPGVSVIIPVYNASGRIKQKVEDILNVVYPTDKLEVIVVSDGSTDSTIKEAESVSTPNVHIYQLDSNSGKSAAQNYGVKKAKNDFLVFTDVDAFVTKDAIEKMVKHFADPQVGCVGANIKYSTSKWEKTGSQSVYWSIEEMLRKAESRYGVLLSVCGSTIAVRKDYFRPLDHDTGDDFIIPMDLALQGNRTVFADDAIVLDMWPARGLSSELKVRRRITLRNLIGLTRRKHLLNPLFGFWMAFSVCSHKLLRWFAPIFMIVMLATSSYLAGYSDVYSTLLILQISFYILAVSGIVTTFFGKRVPIFGQLGSFLWTHIGVFGGILSFIIGHRIRGYSN